MHSDFALYVHSRICSYLLHDGFPKRSVSFSHFRLMAGKDFELYGNSHQIILSNTRLLKEVS